MKKNIKTLLVSLMLLSIYSCTEIWDGKIRPREDILVVKALLSDAPNGQFVELYTTSGYGQEISQTPEQGARVWVESEQGQQWSFLEIQPGMYRQESLRAQKGVSYKLFVELADGSRFESVAQTLMPVRPLDTILGVFGDRLIDIYDHNLDLQPQWAQGIELYTDLDMGGEFAKRIRFDNQVLFQYQVVLNDSLICLQYMPGAYHICHNIDPRDPPRMNCRTRLPLNDVVNISLPDFDLATGELYQHPLGFAPRDRIYYNLSFPGTLFRRALIVEQFGLTEEAFHFYRQIREQLLAENALFDPVATQITGNMRCVSDPDRIVLGLFEVAGSSRQTFVMSYEPWQPHNIWLREIQDLSFLPAHECFYETIPAHWIFN